MPLGHDRTRIYKLSEMDAGHVSAWSQGGDATIDNCQTLCRECNRRKNGK